jgi:hypothetical protein
MELALLTGKGGTYARFKVFTAVKMVWSKKTPTLSDPVDRKRK